ncbi:dTDP-4-dehydrorhamnose 3,5-epimerase [candidate division FCPU426 bacterium]|nr:dTDP-4-dehydrorhamnose 3,5-epimerase [candidate division FCPU426 bacterium]
MKFTPLAIKDVVCIEPRVHGDGRGFFLETYHAPRFAENGLPVDFVQDNHSRSARGVIRGLHYQAPPREQGKLIRVVRGAVFDVAVDIRRDSPTFGRWVAEILDEANKKMLYVPPGFAHGFCSLQEGTDVLYKVTSVYSPECERGVLWNDPAIGIAWPEVGRDYIVSAKDQNLPRLGGL